MSDQARLYICKFSKAGECVDYLPCEYALDESIIHYIAELQSRGMTDAEIYALWGVSV